MPIISNQIEDHDQLSGVTAAQHHPNYSAWPFDMGSSLYQLPGHYIGATLTRTLDINEIFYCPFFLSHACTVDRIGSRCVTAESGKTARWGIYTADHQSNGELAPASLVLDAGTVSLASTGDKAITIDQALDAGYYFATVVQDSSNPAHSGPDIAKAYYGVTSGVGTTLNSQGATLASVVNSDAHGSGFASTAVAPDTLRDPQFLVARLRIA